MVKARFVVNPFPALDLSEEDLTNLQNLANSIIQANLDSYNEHVKTNKRKVNSARWKLVKEREELQVYAERSSARSDPNALPALLSVGKISDDLDDLMFGVVNPTLEVMRVKASYVDDIQGGAVLATLVAPTLDQPFNSLVLKWMELDLPGSSINLVKNRDYIYLEGTGYIYRESGERLGYHLLHSVSFPQTYDLPNRIRGNLSICGFFRQAGPKVIEQYVTGILDPRGDMIRVLVVPSIATAFVSSLKYPYCGQMKKLAWALEQRYDQAKNRGTPNAAPTCVTCSSPIVGRKLGDFGKSSSSCKLCFGLVCASCKVQKKISFVSPDLNLAQRKVTFCKGCLMETTKLNATNAARGQILTNGIMKSSHLSSNPMDSEKSFSSGTYSMNE